MTLSPVLEPPPAARTLFVSPHLDDAVFACGRLLASIDEALVATVCAGRPAPGQSLTEWDLAGGFAAGDDVVGMRREEDRQALEQLGARPCWLDFRDDQYGGADAVEIAIALDRVLQAWQPAAVFIPLGLFHADHRRTREAALAIHGSRPAGRWYAYEESFYRLLPGLRHAALVRLRDAGFMPSARGFADAPQAAARKRRAVACYRSQLRALTTPGRPGHEDLDRAETYWLLRTEEGG